MTLPASDHIHAVTWGMQGPYGVCTLYVYGVSHRSGKFVWLLLKKFTYSKIGLRRRGTFSI